MRRRAGRAFPIVLLTGLSLYYLFRPTGEHAPLMNAISPAAEWVSFHESPGRRYDELLAQPWLREILNLADVETDEATRFWIRELFPGEVLIAREGGMGVGFTPGWVLVSRISGRQTRLRLMLDLFGLDGYERVGKHNGNVLWTLFEEGQTPMTVTLANGKLIFVVHEDPQAIREVLERLEGRRHRFSRFRALPEDLLPEQAAPDNGFWLGNHRFRETFGVVSDFSDPAAPRLRFRGPLAEMLALVGTELNHETAARLGGPATLAMLRMPGFSGTADVPLHLLAVGGAFRSPMALVNLPTLVLIQNAETEADARRQARERMNDLSHVTGLHWSSVETREGLTFLPEDRMLRRLMPSEHFPASRWRDGRLFLASSGATLTRLMTRMDEPAAEFELRDVPWLDRETFLWMSGARMAADLGGLVSVLNFFPLEGLDATAARRWLRILPHFELVGTFSEKEAVLELRHLSQE